MPKADETHYDLLTSAIHHYVYAVEVEPGIAEKAREAARRSIANIRRVALQSGDPELRALCTRARRVVTPGSKSEARQPGAIAEE
jgi:hypothetical protein